MTQEDDPVDSPPSPADPPPAAPPPVATDPRSAADPNTDPSPKYHNLAIVSVILGALSFANCCCCFSAPIPVAAIITGALGLNGIKGDPRYKGTELAYVGIALGVLNLVFSLAITAYQIFTAGFSSIGENPWERF